jgi:hypothetical protein
MASFKGVVVGLAALVLFVVAFFIIEMIWASHQFGGPVSIDISHFPRQPILWLGAVVSFAVCFYWSVSRSQRRRLRK